MDAMYIKEEKCLKCFFENHEAFDSVIKSYRKVNYHENAVAARPNPHSGIYYHTCQFVLDKLVGDSAV